MKSASRMKRLVAKSLISTFTATALVYADAPAPKWSDTLALSGYVQGSYVGNLSAPQPQTGGAMNRTRAFDEESNSFNLNAFHLQVAKPMSDDNYAFTAKLHTGRDARVIHSAGTGGANDFDLQEAYLTVAVPSLKKLTFTGGKFVTFDGVEVIESPVNPNFSEGLFFTYAEPFTHTGVKANYVFTDKVNASVGVVNGWDTTADSNDGKTIIWQIATTPAKMLTWTFEGTYGPEALTGSNKSERTSLDTVANIMPTDKLSLWFQANWGQDTNVTPLAPTTAGNSTVHWGGVGVWAQYAFNSWYTEALRFEVFADQNGAARLGTALAINPGPAVNQTMKEITWTHKFQVAKNMFTRLEYRHDWSNVGFFLGHAPGSTGTNQNTISADYVLTF